MAMTMLEAGVLLDDLLISRKRGLALVDDGQTHWICRAFALDAAVQRLTGKYVLHDDGESLLAAAYAELCREVTLSTVVAACEMDRNDDDAAALCDEAVETGLIDSDDQLAVYYDVSR